MFRFHCLTLVVLSLLALPFTVHAATLTLVSSTAAGLAANAASTSPILSADGSVVVFNSTAGNIGKDIPLNDLFRFRNKKWEQLPTTYNGAVANGSAGPAALSPDGRYTAFLSQATNLLASTLPAGMLYLHDATTGKLRMVSRNAAGQAANRPCYGPRAGGGGKFGFFSQATNLGHPGQTGGYQLYLYDPLTGTITTPLLNAAGAPITQPFNGISFSADGRYIVVSTQGTFIPGADGLSHIWRGRLPATNGGVIQWQPVDTGLSGMADGPSYSGVVSADGEWVAFTSAANNLASGASGSRWNVYRKNMSTDELLLASWGLSGVNPNGNSWEPSISADGRVMGFSTTSTNLVTGDTNGKQDIVIFVQSNTNSLQFIDPLSGAKSNGHSSAPQVSADGKSVAFTSEATNLVAGDTNGVSDVFLWQRPSLPAVVTASHTPKSAEQNCLRRQPITVKFTQNVNPASVPSRYEVKVGDVDWEGVLSWPTPNRVMRFVPKTPYPAGSTVTVTLAAGIEKEGGGVYTNAEEFSFAVQTNPTVLSYGPKSSTVHPAANLNVVFDQPMDKASVEQGFKIDPAVAGVFSWAGNKLIFNPTGNLASDTSYTVTIGAPARARNVNAGSLSPAGWGFDFHTAPSAPGAALTLTAAATDSGVVQITANAASAGELTVEVLNLAGKTVGALPAQPVASGLSTLLWNRKSLTGTNVPRGQYLLRGSLRSAEGRHATVLASVCLR